MDLERRQREAGLPPLSGPEPMPNGLHAKPPGDGAEREAARAREASRRSRERRAKKKSAGRARAALVAGSLLAMLGLGGAMWLGADDGTAQSEAAPIAGQGGASAQPEPDLGVEVPAAPQASPAPAERAPQVSSGAS